MTDPTIEHVLCGACLPETYLCGTPRLEPDEENLVGLGTPHNESPCAVCFAQPVMTCGECGERIRTSPKPVEIGLHVVGYMLLFLAGFTLFIAAFKGGQP